MGIRANVGRSSDFSKTAGNPDFNANLVYMFSNFFHSALLFLFLRHSGDQSCTSQAKPTHGPDLACWPSLCNLRSTS